MSVGKSFVVRIMRLRVKKSVAQRVVRRQCAAHSGSRQIGSTSKTILAENCSTRSLHQVPRLSGQIERTRTATAIIVDQLLATDLSCTDTNTPQRRLRLFILHRSAHPYTVYPLRHGDVPFSLYDSSKIDEGAFPIGMKVNNVRRTLTHRRTVFLDELDLRETG